MAELTPDYCPRTSWEMANFLRRHEALANALSEPTANSIEQRVALLEEHLLVYKKPDCINGEHVLICASDVGGWTATRPLLEAMLQDARVATVSLELSGMALYRGFNTMPYAEKFIRVNPPETPLFVKRDLISYPEYSHSPVSTVVVTCATYIGSEVTNLLAAKTAYGAQKLFICFDSWAPLDPNTIRALPESDRVDGILCNDDFACSIVERTSHGLVTRDLLYDTGTGQCLVPTPIERFGHYYQVRDDLGISSQARVIAFLGTYLDKDCTYGLTEDLNLVALSDMIDQLSGYQPLHILVRPHPADPAADRLKSLCQQTRDDAIVLHWAGRDRMSIDQACSAADIVVTLNSTETLKAPLRQNIGLFFDSPSLRGTYQLWRVYEDALVSDESGISVVSEKQDWERIFMAADARGIDYSAPSVDSLAVGSRMLNRILMPIN